MKLLKNSTRSKFLLILSAGVVVLLILFGTCSYFKDKPEPAIVSYTGNNGSYKINFRRFTDYETFLKAKSPDIIIYNTKQEMEGQGRGYIAGNVEYNGKGKLDKCTIEFKRDSPATTNTIAYNMKPDEITSPIVLTFSADDFSDSKGDIYKSVILRFNDKEVPIPLKMADEPMS